MTKQLLIVANTPSVNTHALAEAVLQGALTADTDNVNTRLLSCFDAHAEDVLNADAIILGTTENLGYMSGAMKDFFDRIYYPCLSVKQGLPCALYIRAGHDGTGTKRAIETIVTGLKWHWARPPEVLKGTFDDDFITKNKELGEWMACCVDAGII